MLAEAGVEGGSVEKILWELPLSVGSQLQHAALIRAGLSVVETLTAGKQGAIRDYRQQLKEFKNGKR